MESRDHDLPPLINAVFPVSNFDIGKDLSIKTPCTIAMCDDLRAKDSLLFQAAVSFALEEEIVCYFIPRPLSKLPPSLHGMPLPTPTTMQNIKFIYSSDTDELRDIVASLHSSKPYPGLIVVDQLDYYFRDLIDDIDVAIAKFLGLLIDSANFIGKERKQICPIIISYTDKDCSLLNMIWKVFFSQLWKIENSNNTISDRQSFNLIITETRNLQVEHIVKFNVKEHYVFLEEVNQVKR